MSTRKITIDPSDLITPTQAAEILGTTKQQMNRWLKRGDLPTITIAGYQLLRRSTLKRPEIKPGRKPKT